ncbi:DUF1266 domain-containing protein, partial [Treponema sp. OttesenSCG-928-L16]|nr:DUF1266 domain-containing protein [Treponema sp. OttesenSCG-928-L16]
TVSGDCCSGIFAYKDGSAFDIRSIERNKRYTLFFILTKENEESETFYSRQLLILEDAIRLDFTGDFYPDVMEAIQRYSSNSEDPELYRQSLVPAGEKLSLAGIPLALEIVNIPKEQIGRYAIATLNLSGSPETPRVSRRMDRGILSGILKFRDNTEFYAGQAEENIRHTVILVIANDDGSESETFYSRQLLVNSGLIALDFNRDFFEDVNVAVRKYTPNPNRLSARQQWAIALTGIMTERNGDQHDMLSFSDMNEKNIAGWVELLRRDWKVGNREELLAMLEETEHNGIKEALKTVKEIVQDNTNFSIIDIFNKHRVNSRYYNYLKFTVLNWGLYKDRTITAWDWGRCISLCRWAYGAGYISEEEAWEKIFYYAEKIKPLYASWQEYGLDYYLGRIFWAAGFGDDITYLLETDKAYKSLFAEDGLWSRLDWYIPAGE